MTEVTQAGPRITVATVVYNGACDIARTIDSSLAQTYPDVEHVVVDGASRDGTQQIIAGYGSAIDTFISEPDRGIYDAMNKALDHATGELILFMNCGDVFASNDALSHAAEAALAGRQQLILGRWLRQGARGQRTLCKPSLPSGIFNHQSILYSRSLHDQFGRYVSSPGFTTADYLFFTAIISSNIVPCVVVDEIMAVIDTGGVSAGPQTLSQKLAIDFLFGRTNRLKLLSVLAIHPLYRRMKLMVRNRL